MIKFCLEKYAHNVFFSVRFNMQYFVLILEIIGTVAFAISGEYAAVTEASLV